MSEIDKSSSLAGEAYLTVRQRILRGEVAVGQAISRRKVAAELGMSFLPVSEAFMRLEFEGLLESRARAGTRVRIPTREDIAGHYAVREALEVQSARLFAQHSTRDEKSELARIALRVDSLGQSPDADRIVYLSLHERLHGRIAECARCPALSGAIEKTHALASTWNCVSQKSGRPRKHHQELMKMLSKGDPEAAEKAMREHIVSSRERTLARLEAYFETGKNKKLRYVRSAVGPLTDISLDSF
jgi:GntR family transcriptional regulator, rspAB operon transcriptional repressor